MSKAKLLQGLIVTNSKSSIDGATVDILLSGSEARIVKHNSQKGDFEIINYAGCMLTPAFTDLSFSLPDPGFEYRENFESAEKLALASGFQRLCCLPNTDPVIDGKSEVNYYIKNSRQSKIDFLPLGAISKELKGEEMAELYDMHLAGAVAFSNADKAIKQSGLLKRALQYVQSFNGLIFSFPFDETVSVGGVMHEGEISVSLGLKGLPELSEFLMVKRDLEILRYAGGRLHFSGISCAESVAMIKEAKKEGLQVTCDVRAMNLLFTDENLKGFDSVFKVMPPLRTEKHRKALIAGLKDGTIDAISSGHRPLDTEVTDVEFMYAKYGASTLQSIWSKLLEELAGKIGASKLAALLSSGPETVLGIKADTFAYGVIDNFVITRDNAKQILNKTNNLSLSANSPFMGASHQYLVAAVFIKNKLTIHK
ncbi:MAG: dihydroorotase [Bacteroidia bacterium]|nr:dihydroorotase [Bacteroidia bacterium]MCO5253971.1 dihydroorotase [Bacteroidota bacterium]